MATNLIERVVLDASDKAKSFDKRCDVAAGGKADEGGSSESISSRTIKLGVSVIIFPVHEDLQITMQTLNVLHHARLGLPTSQLLSKAAPHITNLQPHTPNLDNTPSSTTHLPP